MKKLTTGNKISLGAIAFILCVVIAFNIACFMLFELITGFFHGSGIEFTSAATQQALAVSDELCREMVGEENICPNINVALARAEKLL